MSFKNPTMFYKSIFMNMEVDTESLKRPKYVSKKAWNSLSPVGKLLVEGERDNIGSTD